MTIYAICVTGGSEDGRSMPRLGDVGRSDSGEVEMTEFERPGPSSEETAGTRAGEAALTVQLLHDCILARSPASVQVLQVAMVKPIRLLQQEHMHACASDTKHDLLVTAYKVCITCVMTCNEKESCALPAKLQNRGPHALSA